MSFSRKKEKMVKKANVTEETTNSSKIKQVEVGSSEFSLGYGNLKEIARKIQDDPEFLKNFVEMEMFTYSTTELFENEKTHWNQRVKEATDASVETSLVSVSKENNYLSDDELDFFVKTLKEDTSLKLYQEFERQKLLNDHRQRADSIDISQAFEFNLSTTLKTSGNDTSVVINNISISKINIGNYSEKIVRILSKLLSSRFDQKIVGTYSSNSRNNSDGIGSIYAAPRDENDKSNGWSWGRHTKDSYAMTFIANYISLWVTALCPHFNRKATNFINCYSSVVYLDIENSKLFTIKPGESLDTGNNLKMFEIDSKVEAMEKAMAKALVGDNSKEFNKYLEKRVRMSATNKLRTLLTKEHHLKDVLNKKVPFSILSDDQIENSFGLYSGELDSIWDLRQIYKSIEDPKQKARLIDGLERYFNKS